MTDAESFHIILIKHEGAQNKEAFPGKTKAHLPVTVDLHRSNS